MAKKPEPKKLSFAHISTNLKALEQFEVTSSRVWDLCNQELIDKDTRNKVLDAISISMQKIKVHAQDLLRTDEENNF